MKMFNKVVIIGTGLIGGSLGLVLKQKGLAGQVIGLSRHLKNARLAKQAGAIDQVGTSLEVVEDADLIILATPVNVIISMASQIAKRIKKDCLVIDVGSSKELIVAGLTRLLPNFLGCHPLAGSEKKGIINSTGNIFKDSVCIITPTVKTKIQTLSKIKMLWKKIGAQVVLLSAKEHDKALAFTSHLPHVLAFSLISSIPEGYLSLSSSGLKDTTRIAGSDAQLWSEIFLSNRVNLLATLRIFQKQLAILKFALKNKNKPQLIRLLLLANAQRNKL